MSSSKEFRNFVLDQLEEVEGVTARAMFGGFGIFRDGVMFGLIAQGTLYFKADDINRTAHEGAGMPPFRYTRGDKVREMSYWQVPLDVLEDPVELATWTYHAIAAAGRGQSEKSKT